MLPQVASSATILAFHAPPAAVQAPVTQKGKIAGKINVRHIVQPLNPYVLAASRRSFGMAMAPAMTLNRIYHWVPIAISKMLPQLIPMWAATKKPTTKGKVILTGNEAAIWANGWAKRAISGLEPIQTPIGVQIKVAITVIKA